MCRGISSGFYPTIAFHMHGEELRRFNFDSLKRGGFSVDLSTIVQKNVSHPAPTLDWCGLQQRIE